MRNSPTLPNSPQLSPTFPTLTYTLTFMTLNVYTHMYMYMFNILYIYVCTYILDSNIIIHFTLYILKWNKLYSVQCYYSVQYYSLHFLSMHNIQYLYTRYCILYVVPILYACLTLYMGKHGLCILCK